MKILISIFILFLSLPLDSRKDVDLGVIYYFEFAIGNSKYYTSVFLDGYSINEKFLKREGTVNEYVFKSIETSISNNTEIYDKFYVKQVNLNLRPPYNEYEFLNNTNFHLLDEKSFQINRKPDIKYVKVIGREGVGGIFSKNIIIDGDWLSDFTIDRLFSFEEGICYYNFYGVKDWYTEQELNSLKQTLETIKTNRSWDSLDSALENIYSNDIIMLGGCSC